jgi:hypothetical protein
VTHAVIDGIRTYFTEPTNPDVLAFHEGFADLCALFAHFSHKEALTDAIRRTGGRLYQTDLAPVAPRAAGEPNAPQTITAMTILILVAFVVSVVGAFYACRPSALVGQNELIA